MKKQSSYLALIIMLLGAFASKTVFGVGTYRYRKDKEIFNYVSENILNEPEAFARGLKIKMIHYQPSFLDRCLDWDWEKTVPYDLSKIRDKDGNTLAHAAARTILDFYEKNNMSVLGFEGFPLSKNALANLEYLKKGHHVDLDAKNKAGDTPIFILTGNGNRILLAGFTIRLAGAECDPRCCEKFYDYYSEKALKTFYKYIHSGIIVD